MSSSPKHFHCQIKSNSGGKGSSRTSAAAWPVWLEAAVSAEVQAALVEALALQDVLNCPQMKEAMIPMLSAEPWLKSERLDGSKESSVRPSKPAPKTMDGSEQEPKSSAEVLAAPVATAEAAAVADTAGQSEAAETALATADEATADEATGEAALVLLDALAVTPATAALTSAAVASSTNKFWVKMQPVVSSAVSQVCPCAS